MILSILVFLLSVTETDSFVPFPSGYSISQQDGLSTVSVDQEEGFFSLAPGAPFLPSVSRTLILPGNCKVTSTRVHLNPAVDATRIAAPLAGAPVLQTIGTNGDRSLTATTISIIPQDNTFSVRTGHILDAYTIVSVSVNPWIYDSETQELGLASTCTIQMEWEESKAQTSFSTLQVEMVNFRMAALADQFSTSFTPLYTTPATDGSVDYLIITGEEFLSEIATLEELLEDKDISFQTVTVQQIAGNWGGVDTQEDIRNCIRHYAYNEGTVYVALAGDETVIPAREVYTECEGLSEFAPIDLYYADLDGTWDFNSNGIYGEWADSLDLYADVLLGRLLFSTSAGANAILNKNTTYANVSNNETWFKSAVLCGAILFDSIGYTSEKGCEMMAEEYPNNFLLTKAYETSPGVYPETYRPVIYNGAGWNHYAGHGNDRGVYWIDHSGILSISRMSGFMNPGRTGIHSSIGCHTGDFTDPGVCLPDTLLTLPDAGGVAGFFNTSWGWEGYWPEIGSSERLTYYTVQQVYSNHASSLGLAYTTAKDLEIPHLTGPYDRVMQSVLAYTGFMDPALQVLGVSSFNPIPPSPFQLQMLSPNPLSTGYVSFKVTGSQYFYETAIYDLMGRTVSESATQQQNTMRTVDVRGLPNGVYFVSAKAPNGVTVSGSFVVLQQN